MLVLRRAVPALVIIWTLAGPGVAADTGALTLEEALALARERAPVVLAARARVEEARGRLSGAAVRLGANPVLQAGIGRRNAAGEGSTDFEVELTQELGVAGRRRARIAGAEAAMLSEEALAEEIERAHTLEVAEAFLRALHAGERLRLSQGSHDTAIRIAHAAERRFQAGDVAVLDVHVAQAARARALSEVNAWKAEEAAALGALRVLLGARPGESTAIRGDLGRVPAHDLSRLIVQAADRPDLRALAARIDQADAEVRLGRTFRRPGLEVGLRYEEEGNDEIAMGLLAVSLPVFDRGQGASSEAVARAGRLRMEHESLRAGVEAEVRTAFEVHRQRVEAEAAIRTALPGLTESEQLAARSYESGQIGLSELMLLRRDLQETRIAHIDRQLEAAVSGIRLEASAGVL
ncbi:MAG TPA: TolC family protein [Candidatus Polarisedimenticolia bacterium]|nr:TolC family protein [Candidatus Polarisedimenticolia bacterium]